MHGTYVSIEPFHLFRYVDEPAFRFKNHQITDRERFSKVAGSVFGKRLTYRELTRKGAIARLAKAGSRIAPCLEPKRRTALSTGSGTWPSAWSRFRATRHGPRRIANQES
ncbi:MAG: hypothetical protein ACREPA_06955 [Candidatus Dormibacteraceae bacterium]